MIRQMEMGQCFTVLLVCSISFMPIMWIQWFGKRNVYIKVFRCTYYFFFLKPKIQIFKCATRIDILHAFILFRLNKKNIDHSMNIHWMVSENEKPYISDSTILNNNVSTDLVVRFNNVFDCWLCCAACGHKSPFLFNTPIIIGTSTSSIGSGCALLAHITTKDTHKTSQTNPSPFYIPSNQKEALPSVMNKL